MSLNTRAPVKVNLCLHVGPVRDDGLHELASLAVFPDFGDEIEVHQADDITIDISGPFAGQLARLPAGENLVVRAAYLLKSNSGCSKGARITLTKNVPVASGIGGGTADAAAALILLRTLWQTGTSDEALLELSFQLGADGPVCLASHLFDSGVVMMTGAGEHVRPGPGLPRFWICLINPLQPVATRKIFNAFDEQYKTPDKPIVPRFNNMIDFQVNTRNDLQPFAEAECPEITSVLSLLSAAPGNIMARMSGSGATCFGLFENMTDAASVKEQAARNGWWAQSARISR